MSMRRDTIDLHIQFLWCDFHFHFLTWSFFPRPHIVAPDITCMWSPLCSAKATWRASHKHMALEGVREIKAQIKCSQNHSMNKKRSHSAEAFFQPTRCNSALARTHTEVMGLFSNQQIAFMRCVSGEACEASIRSFSLCCFPVALHMAMSANWIGWPFFAAKSNWLHFPPKRCRRFNYHKFLLLVPLSYIRTRERKDV